MITIKELSDWLSVKPKTIYSWAELGQIPVVKINGALRFIREDIEKWIEENKKGYNGDAQTSRCPKKGGRK